MNAHDNDDDDRFPPSTFYSHHQHTNPCGLHPPRYRLFSVHGFRFPSRSACFAIFSHPILSATFKRFIYDTFIHTTWPYRIDGGELARYTTPYLNFYGLVGPFTLRPALHILLSLIAWTSKQRITHHHHQHPSSFFYMFSSHLGNVERIVFFFLCICHHHHHIFFHPSFLLDSQQPRNLYPDNFGIMSFPRYSSIPLAFRQPYCDTSIGPDTFPYNVL